MPDDKADSKSRPVSLNEADKAIATFVATLENLVRKAPVTRESPVSRQTPVTRQTPSSTRRRS